MTVKIALLDDELSSFTYNDLDEKIKSTLASPGGRKFRKIWEFGNSKGLLPSIEEQNPESIENIVQSQCFIDNILFHKDFLALNIDDVTDILEAQISERNISKSALEKIKLAFSDPTKFTITELTERPRDASKLREYDLIVMDMMMNDKLSYETLARYIKEIPDLATERVPLIILISHKPDLNKYRVTFRKIAQIPSPGFCIIGKRSILDPNFGESGITHIWEQMQAQKKLSIKVKKLYLSWETAFKNAWNNVNNTLWSLDIAALQQIHLGALSDNDPFDEHIHEILAKHHQWFIENNENVQENIAALSDELDNTLTFLSGKKNTIKIKHCQSYSDNADKKVNEINNHHFWSGFPPKILVNDIDTNDENLGALINRLLPLGLILSKDTQFPLEGKVLLHLTQQCDLNRTDILKRGTSLLFVVGDLSKEKKSINNNEPTLMIPLNNNNESWYLYINKSSLVAIPIDRAIRFFKIGKWNSHLRMRSETAREIRNEIFSHSNRFAQVKQTTSSTMKAVAIILINKDDIKKILLYKDQDNRMKYIDVKSFNGDYSIINDENTLLPVWVKTQASYNQINLECNTSSISEELRNQLSLKDIRTLFNLQIKIMDHREQDLPLDETELLTFISSKENLGKNKVLLYIALINE